MSKLITLKRGLDLRLVGALAPDSPTVKANAGLYAICPEDFPGFQPKVEVREGDAVLCGAPLLRDKVHEKIKLVSPVEGTVLRVIRGERRRILAVTVMAATPGAAGHSVKLPSAPTTAAQAKEFLMASGLWAMMRQRPYAIVPNPDNTPRDIFVTAFDSAPLAPAIDQSLSPDDLNAGVALLRLLTPGNIYLSIRPDSPLTIPEGAVGVTIKGPHPAGNPGVQAANIAPVNKGETIWTLSVDTLARIGHTILSGAADWSVKVALTGSETKRPRFVDTFAGAELSAIIDGDIKADNRHHRIISGNVLCGRSNPEFLRYPYRQITIIPEGDDVDEFMGWASLSPSKMSQSFSFPARLMPWKKFNPDARLNGGRRAMIMSGLYEKMLPMDIMPEYLIKAILARDIDRMEALGIYEVAPDDFALCEYVDPSKLELQQIVRKGLDYLRKETE